MSQDDCKVKAVPLEVWSVAILSLSAFILSREQAEINSAAVLAFSPGRLQSPRPLVLSLSASSRRACRRTGAQNPLMVRLATTNGFSGTLQPSLHSPSLSIDTALAWAKSLLPAALPSTPVPHGRRGTTRQEARVNGGLEGTPRIVANSQGVAGFAYSIHRPRPSGDCRGEQRTEIQWCLR